MNTQTEDRLVERIAVPTDMQVRLAEQRRKLAIKRYHLNVRRGAAWFKPSEETGESVPHHHPND